jgi:hypothetical protein
VSQGVYSRVKMYTIWEATGIEHPRPEQIKGLEVRTRHHVAFVEARLAWDRYLHLLEEDLIEQGGPIEPVQI